MQRDHASPKRTSLSSTVAIHVPTSQLKNHDANVHWAMKTPITRFEETILSHVQVCCGWSVCGWSELSVAGDGVCASWGSEAFGSDDCVL